MYSLDLGIIIRVLVMSIMFACFFSGLTLISRSYKKHLPKSGYLVGSLLVAVSSGLFTVIFFVIP